MKILKIENGERTLPGLNEYTNACRRNPFVGAKMKKDAQDVCVWHIREQLRGWTPTPPIRITYRFFEKDKRRDKSNISSFAIKVIEDALQECGKLKNDGWNDIKGFTSEFFIDKDRPRIEVEIKEANE